MALEHPQHEYPGSQARLSAEAERAVPRLVATDLAALARMMSRVIFRPRLVRLREGWPQVLSSPHTDSIAGVLCLDPLIRRAGSV